MHIYVLSRLYEQPATEYRKILQEIKENSGAAFAAYRPFREAVIKLIRGEPHPEKNLKTLLSRVSARQIKTQYSNSLEYLEIFYHLILPRINTIQEIYIRPYGAIPDTTYGPHVLSGGPHFSVSDKKGRFKYIFLKTGVWPPEQLEAHSQLVLMVIENQMNAKSSDLWYIDFPNSTEVKITKKKRVRSKLLDTAALITDLLRISSLEAEV
jgi:hypothetical protein